jgi:DNA-binding PucR family transcriptional regulator
MSTGCLSRSSRSTKRSDPGLAAAALLGGNIESARDWVAEVLGDLAANTDNDARLRDTLRVFLSCDSS